MKTPKNWSMTKLDKMAAKLSQQKGAENPRATLVSLFGHPSK